MFGIFFFNNLDLRRILTDYGFVSHPLRKDFPLLGFPEVSYSDPSRSVLSVNIETNQEFRNFRFRNP